MSNKLQAKDWAFSADGREFIIKNRDLPQPWRNYISTEHASLVMVHTGMGPLFGRASETDRFLAEENPRTVFLRDAQTGKVWNVSGVGGKQPKGWTCTHGFGWTRVNLEKQGIASEITWSISLDDPVEFWKVKLTNTGKKVRKIQCFPSVVWCLGFKGHEEGFDNFFVENGMIFGECHHWPFANFRTSYDEYNRSWDRTAFMACSIKPKRFDTMKEVFYGNGSLYEPDAVKTGRLGNSLKKGAPSCGAMQFEVSIPAGKSVEFTVAVGAAPTKTKAKALGKKYANDQASCEMLAKINKWWDNYLDRWHIDLPDKDIAIFANGWNRYAMWIRLHHRFGYRDTAQDMFAYATFDQPRCRQRIGKLCEVIFQDGSFYHDVDQLGWRHHKSINSDPGAWLPWLIPQFVKETGTLDILDDVYSYVDGGEGSVYEHCVKVLDYYIRERGRYGLPLIKCGDWNDCLMGSNKKGVSVWLAEFLVIAYRDFAKVAELKGKKKDAERFAKEAKKLKRIVNEKCWDGKWFVRAFDDEGKPIGTKKEREGRIFMNPQTWAVLGDIASPERSEMCLKSVEKLMDTPVGIPMFAPPYTKIQQRIGLISRMAHGYHHNGGSWNHAVTWDILAECKIGRPDRALEIYKKLFPPYLSKKYSRHISEPYCHTSFTNTPVSGETGRTGVGWNTGTVCWIYRVLHEGFAGVVADFDGLHINPCLPKGWKNLAIKRPYQGNVLEISIENPKGVQSGVKEILVDGEAITGNVVSPFADKKKHHIQVIMG